MPNSVLWICLVAIWLFVLVPMVIQGRPELRKSTPVAAATRVLKRGEEAVRRRRVGAGAHPHDPDYQPKKPKTAKDLLAEKSMASGESDAAKPAADAKPAAQPKPEPVEVDPKRIPGKVPTRKRGAARTVAARMRRIVSVNTTRNADQITEVIPVVDTDEIIDAEIVEESTTGTRGSKVDEVLAVEVIDVEITERIEPIADDSPTEKIDKVDADKTDVKMQAEPATLFDDLEEEPADEEKVPSAGRVPDERSEAGVSRPGETKPEAEDDDQETVPTAGRVPDEEKVPSAGRVLDERSEAGVSRPGETKSEAEDDEFEIDEFDDEIEEDDTEAARWDDVDPNELTQVLMTRPGRGGYDPEVDRARLDLKYKERQRVLLALVGLTLLTIGAGVLFSTPGWIAAGVMGVALLAYLFFLRRAVRSEAQIRERRLARLERSRREEVARRRREFADEPMADVAPAPRPRMRRPSGMNPVAIDDEDPIFDHLPIYEPPRMMRSDDDYRRAAVG